MENNRFCEGAFRSVRWHIAYYWEIRRAITDRRLELKRNRGMVERRSEGYFSSPTEKEAEINIMELPYVYLSIGGKVDKPEQWVLAINHVMDKLEPEDRRLIEESFWKSRSWRTAIAKLCMDKMTYYKRRDHLIYVFAVYCASKGLIDID